MLQSDDWFETDADHRTKEVSGALNIWNHKHAIVKLAVFEGYCRYCLF
jgi:hypothetical protein